MNNIIFCPNCHESNYAEIASTVSASYPSFQSGTSVCGNSLTVECECLNCHYQFWYKVVNGRTVEIIPSGYAKPREDIVYINSNSMTSFLDKTIVSNNESIRDAEIKRLQEQIKSLQDQLLEIQANPQWTQKINI